MTTNQICYLLSQKLVITHYRKRTQALFYICDYKKNVSKKTKIMKKKKNKKQKQNKTTTTTYVLL